MRARGRVDANQADIVQKLRQCGVAVKVTSSVGEGFPDLIVAYRGRNVLLEVKDPGKSPSARGLTAEQRLFHERWPGPIAVVHSFDEAMEAILEHTER